jgi:twitching motility protein PilT
MTAYQPGASPWPSADPQGAPVDPAPVASVFPGGATTAYVPGAYGSVPASGAVAAAPVPAVPPPAAAPSAVLPATPVLPVVAPPARAEVLPPASPLLDAVLHAAVAADASDVHLVAGMAPLARIDGSLRVFEGHGPISDADLRAMLLPVVSDVQRERFLEDHELDFAYQLDSGDAFRTNFYLQTGAMAAAFRLIPERIRPLSELGVPEIVGTFASLPRGLVLVTGPTGSGKSTTLAAVIDQANATRDDHILTVEDPIEFRHRSRRCLVTQREVGSDTESFGIALRQALRQDPDIILVGELRDLETIQVALTAAETGHLVLGTLHTQDSGQTVDRIIDAFPTGAQSQVRRHPAGHRQPDALPPCGRRRPCGRDRGAGHDPGRALAHPRQPHPPALLDAAWWARARHAHPRPEPGRAGAARRDHLRDRSRQVHQPRGVQSHVRPDRTPAGRRRPQSGVVTWRRRPPRPAPSSTASSTPQASRS